MSKRAKERAIEMYPTLTSPSFEEANKIIFTQMDRLVAYIAGYEQAEKDLALTKDDVWTIYNLVRELQVKYSATEGCLQEVADIFNEQRKK